MTLPSPNRMTMSVIIPVWNGRDHLAKCLSALAASTRQADEVIVVDDGSIDDSATIARTFDVKVVRLAKGPHGPATARNRGVSASRGRVLVFIDCDVAVHRETLDLMENELQNNPDVCGVFGSYDDQPAAPGPVSRYRNLMHHHVHQQSRREASTFWAGCGALRREAFEAENGFDETYRWASIEDIELGLRLKSAGQRLLLCREIQVTHAKRWTFAEMVHTDIFRRAAPWAKLLLKESALPNDLNLRRENRLSALASVCLLIILLLGFILPSELVLAAIPIAILLAANRSLYALFHRHGGLLFSLGAILLHWLHYLYSTFAFGMVAIVSLIRVESPSLDEAPAEGASVPAKS